MKTNPGEVNYYTGDYIGAITWVEPDPMKIRLHEPTFGEEEIQAVVDVMRSTNITSGEKVREFESKFGPNAVMCNSGSSANLLVIAALCHEGALKRGDKVIVSALSWATTVWPLVQHGLVPVIVDIDPNTLNIDPKEVEKALGPKTKAIMPVHVYGNPCDMTPLLLCHDAGILLIEDCCEALGAESSFGKSVGTFGDAATFSFYYSHHITTGEGGMCVTKSPALGERMRILRAHGWTRDLKYGNALYREKHSDIDQRFLFVNAGYNLRCTEMQAAMGLVQLPKLEGFVEARREAAKLLKGAFSGYIGNFATQRETGKSSWFGFPIIVRKGSPFTAANVRRHFEAHGIETRSIICGNIARQPGLKDSPHVVCGSLEHADHVMNSGFSIGCHQDMGEVQCGRVKNALDIFMEGQFA